MEEKIFRIWSMIVAVCLLYTRNDWIKNVSFCSVYIYLESRQLKDWLIRKIKQPINMFVYMPFWMIMEIKRVDEWNHLFTSVFSEAYAGLKPAIQTSICLLQWSGWKKLSCFRKCGWPKKFSPGRPENVFLGCTKVNTFSTC